MTQFATVLLGFIAGIAGSLIAPWVNWGVEKKREKLSHRRELIKEWRKMVKQVIEGVDQENVTPLEMLQRHEAYYSLERHLSKKTRFEVHTQRTFKAGSTISASLSFILDEVSELEKKWKLI